MKKEVVIYTAISGDYDYLYRVPKSLRKYRFICFSDKLHEGLNINGWEILSFPDSHLDNVRKCRDVKIRPHIYLKNYEYSVWLDANISFKGKLDKDIDSFINSEDFIRVFEHPSRNCIYVEAEYCSKKEKDNPDIISSQVRFYQNNLYPYSNGLIESNVIFRLHNHPLIVKTMNDWWAMVLGFSKRDQLSFNYCAWKNNLAYNTLNGNARYGNSTFKIRPHRKKLGVYLRESIMNLRNRVLKKT